MSQDFLAQRAVTCTYIADALNDCYDSTHTCPTNHQEHHPPITIMSLDEIFGFPSETQAMTERFRVYDGAPITSLPLERSMLTNMGSPEHLAKALLYLEWVARTEIADHNMRWPREARNSDFACAIRRGLGNDETIEYARDMAFWRTVAYARIGIHGARGEK